MIFAALTLNVSLAFLRWFRLETPALAGRDVMALLSLCKYAAIMVISGGWILASKQKQFRGNNGALLLFGFADPLATMALIVGGLSVPLALNSILGDLHILLTPLILFLVGRREQVPRHHLLLTFLGFAGVLAFAWPQLGLHRDVSSQMSLPVFAALLWSVCGLLSNKVATKRLAFVQWVTATCGLIMSFILAREILTLEILDKVFGSINFVYALVFSIVAQLFFISSMASGDILAALIAAPAYAVFGGWIGFAFFDEGFGYCEWIGFLLVLLSVVLFHYKPKRNCSP